MTPDSVTLCSHPVTRQILVNGQPSGIAFCPDCGAQLAAPCSHPPARQYAWLARDDTAPAGHVLCVACCDCGAVLQGGAILDEVTP